ncbi:MAG: hypothetical protein QME58_03355 [Bacteroidota bacterium]|nr:hypothetical protein [Bacteroidota bacterium]
MNCIRLFCIYIFCLLFMNFIATGQDDLQLSQSLLDDGCENFVTEYTEDGMKYYIKIIPGDTTVDKNMPMYNPKRKDFVEPRLVYGFENPKPLVKVQPIISEIEITTYVWITVK